MKKIVCKSLICLVIGLFLELAYCSVIFYNCYIYSFFEDNNELGLIAILLFFLLPFVTINTYKKLENGGV